MTIYRFVQVVEERLTTYDKNFNNRSLESQFHIKTKGGDVLKTLPLGTKRSKAHAYGRYLEEEMRKAAEAWEEWDGAK